MWSERISSFVAGLKPITVRGRGSLKAEMQKEMRAYAEELEQEWGGKEPDELQTMKDDLEAKVKEFSEKMKAMPED